MKVITTEYRPCTNTLPARMVANAEGVAQLVLSVHCPILEKLSGEDLHRRIALALCQDYAWLRPGRYLIGSEQYIGVYVFVFSDSDCIVNVNSFEG